MTIPTPGETKMPILNYLSKTGEPAKIAHIAELMGQHFKLSKREIAEEMPKGGRKFATKIGAAIDEMKAKGFVRSTGRGFVEITPQGRAGLRAGTIISRRRGRFGRPPMAQVTVPANGRRKPGRPPKTQTGALTGVSLGAGNPPKAQVKAPINGRRKPGRPKAQPATQLSATIQPSADPAKRDDKLVQKTADIVISYVGKNTVSPNQVPKLIEGTYAALAGLGN